MVFSLDVGEKKAVNAQGDWLKLCGIAGGSRANSGAQVVAIFIKLQLLVVDCRMNGF